MSTIDLGNIKFNWKGTKDTSTAYAIDDVVYVDPHSYVCVQAHTNQAVNTNGNNAYWEIIASGANLPGQTGYAGKALKTDGTNLSWGDGGKLVGSATYDWSTRFSPGHSNSWNDWYGNTYNKQSSTSTLIFTASISSIGEHGGYPQHYWRFGNTNSSVVAAQYGNTAYNNHSSMTFVISGNTQTGSQSWMFLGDQKGYHIVNPNSSDHSNIEQSHSFLTIMEVVV